MYFRTKLALFFRFFDSWYIIKYLLTETSGKQHVLWTLDGRRSRVHRWTIDSLGSTKHTAFSRSQSISISLIYTKSQRNEKIKQTSFENT